MFYMLLTNPNRVWPFKKAVTLMTVAEGITLSFVEGDQPHKGATGFFSDELGECCWWPIFDAPPQQVRAHLRGEFLAKGATHT